MTTPEKSQIRNSMHDADGRPVLVLIRIRKMILLKFKTISSLVRVREFVRNFLWQEAGLVTILHHLLLSTLTKTTFDKSF